MLEGLMLARLRRDLDLMPSPVEDRPGLLIRDPMQYSGATLVVPPELVQCLEFFDGGQTELDLREHLVRISGRLDVSSLVDHFKETLSQAGFLEDEELERLKTEAHRQFAELPTREPYHAGTGYPAETEELASTFGAYISGLSGEPRTHQVRAIAAPHVSPFGGVDAYRAAYSALRAEDADKTFIVLGTSHYGTPDKLGLTRKPYVTPYGPTTTDLSIVERLEREAPGSIVEDYCHAVEHSIEFQVVFLQHLFGANVKVVPILSGSYARSLYRGGMPEEDENVRRSLGVLGEIEAKESDRLIWVLGVDMAHMGGRYGDHFEARAGESEMLAVEQRDRARIACMEKGDAQGFWNLVQENHDDLKWCGSAPIYTFMKTVPDAKGRLRHYQQWNIDEESVVSFAGMEFF
jgi:AmmeMemoRadiSam system protein B